MAMRKNKVHEFEADVPAADLWGLYGTLRAAELLPELLPQVLAKIQLVSGDGDVGTILELTFAPGIPGMVRFEIIAKGPSSSVIRSTIVYEINYETHPGLEAMVSTGPLAATAEKFAAYLKEQKIAQSS